MYKHKDLQKRSHLWRHTFQFDSKIKNTYSGVLETISILALWQKLSAQKHYFYFRPINRLFKQLNIITPYPYTVGLQYDIYEKSYYLENIISVHNIKLDSF